MLDKLLVGISKTKIGQKILDNGMKKTTIRNQELISIITNLEKHYSETSHLLENERTGHDHLVEKNIKLENKNYTLESSIKNLESEIHALKEREAMIETAYMKISGLETALEEKQIKVEEEKIEIDIYKGLFLNSSSLNDLLQYATETISEKLKIKYCQILQHEKGENPQDDLLYIIKSNQPLTERTSLKKNEGITGLAFNNEYKKPTYIKDVSQYPELYISQFPNIKIEWAKKINDAYVLNIEHDEELTEQQLKILETISETIEYTLHRIKNTEKRTSIDSLTGIYNRAKMDEILEIEYERSMRSKTFTPMSLLFFDLNNFKPINDKYGHQAGDEAIKIFAKTLLEKKRKSDYFCRYGGDEFMMILPQTTEKEAAEVRKRIYEIISSIKKEHSLPYNVSASIGYSVLKEKDTIDKLIERADNNMYDQKKQNHFPSKTKSRFKKFFENFKKELYHAFALE